MLRSLVLGALLGLIQLASVGSESCIADPDLNAIFIPEGETSIPLEGSCCQQDVCNIPCPAELPDITKGYGIAVALTIVVSFLIGVATFFVVQGEAENYFVAGHSLPLWIVAMTLGAQSVDSNALLGNVDLSYKYQFFDGAVIPIGLGLSLILNGIFLAHKINGESALTLPDVLAKRYGKVVEVLVSCTTITSFLMLLAGNLVGMGVITAYVWGINETAGIWMSAGIVWIYTVSGGLFSVAYTDVAQGIVGWSGCIICAFWFIANSVPASPPSVGFPGYIYPNDEIADMYEGVQCEFDTSSRCYNVDKWCPDPDSADCFADNGAFPFGDKRIYTEQLVDPFVLTPVPNAIYWNWATIFILAFGNLGALDFQVRCMAAKTPNTARIGCFIGGCFTFFIGIPFAYLGAITRAYYGPDSIYAQFEADKCSESLLLPTCGEWIPDPVGFLNLLTNQAPGWVGGWCLIGIVAASMSTADGAILAMGTVFAHNLMRQLDFKFPNLVTSDNLLMTARLATIPFTLISTMIGAYYRNSDSAAGATGYLLIVAFDIVLATMVAPLFGCFYAKNPSPRAALCSVLTGVVVRVVMEFSLPKDGYLLLPFDSPEFENYGPAASAGLPPFVDGNTTAGEVWDPETEVCDQELFRDFTGVDSLSAFLASIIVFLSVQFLEHHKGGPLFTFPGMEGYVKKGQDEAPAGKELEDDDDSEEATPKEEAAMDSKKEGEKDSEDEEAT